jgi:hypothetical protein
VKNTGKPSEREFEAKYGSLGKRAYVHRLPDAAEIFGRVGKIGLTRAMPSDYLVVCDSQTEFAEVKSTQNKTSFPFSVLKDKQVASAHMITAAGGDYFIYIHRLATGDWYKVPFTVIAATRAAGSASIKWDELKVYKWKI